LGDLPVWRKLGLFCCVGLWSFLGIRHFSEEANIYASAPEAPIAKTKQVYPVHVNRGYLRYVTKEKAQEWEFRRSTDCSYHRRYSIDDVVVAWNVPLSAFLLGHPK
jgi:hypothetical protein